MHNPADRDAWRTAISSSFFLRKVSMMFSTRSVAPSLVMPFIYRRNSSPPNLHAMLFWEYSARIDPTSVSSRSPALCPIVSLIFFKLSTSINARHPFSSCIASAIWVSPTFRSKRPVNESHSSAPCWSWIVFTTCCRSWVDTSSLVSPCTSFSAYSCITRRPSSNNLINTSTDSGSNCVPVPLTSSSRIISLESPLR